MDRLTMLELDDEDTSHADNTAYTQADPQPGQSNQTPKPAQPAKPLEGYLDRASVDRIDGWAFDPATPDRPVRLLILDNGTVIGAIVADQYRDDLEGAGKGSGRHSFLFTFPKPLSPLVRHVIHVRRASDGQDLGNSPRILPADPTSQSPPLDPAGPWRGYLDVVTRDLVTGWAWNADQPGAPATLQVIANGRVIARVVADLHRPDLEQAQIGDGRHGFEVRIPGGLSPLERHRIQVRLEQDGAELPNSPQCIEPASPENPQFQPLVLEALATSTPGSHDTRVLAFLLDQTETLLQRRADADGRRADRFAHQQFRARWRLPAPDQPTHTDPGLRALIVSAHLPTPGQDDMALAHIAALHRAGYAVSVVPAEDLAASSDTLTIHGAPFYASAEDVLRRQAGCFDLVYLNRAPIAAAYLFLARRYNPGARILYGNPTPEHQASPLEAAIAAAADATLTHPDIDLSNLDTAQP